MGDWDNEMANFTSPCCCLQFRIGGMYGMRECTQPFHRITTMMINDNNNDGIQLTCVLLQKGLV